MIHEGRIWRRRWWYRNWEVKSNFLFFWRKKKNNQQESDVRDHFPPLKVARTSSIYRSYCHDFFFNELLFGAFVKIRYFNFQYLIVIGFMTQSRAMKSIICSRVIKPPDYLTKFYSIWRGNNLGLKARVWKSLINKLKFS